MITFASALSRIQSSHIQVYVHAHLVLREMAVAVADEAHGASRVVMHRSVIKKRSQSRWLMNGVKIMMLK